MPSPKDENEKDKDKTPKPQFARLLFWHHANRLSEELKTVLGEHAEKPLCAGATAYCAWIALSAPRPSGGNGFIASGTWFRGDDGEDSRPPPLKCDFELAQKLGFLTVKLEDKGVESAKVESAVALFLEKYNPRTEQSASDSRELEGIPDGVLTAAGIEDPAAANFAEEYQDAFGVPRFMRDFESHLAAGKVVAPNAVPELEALSECPFVDKKTGVHPRDVALAHDLLTIVAGRSTKSLRIGSEDPPTSPEPAERMARKWEDAVVVRAFGKKEKEEAIDMLPLFEDDVDVGARWMIEAAGRIMKDNGVLLFPVLALVPLKISISGIEREREDKALLGVILGLDEEMRGSIFPERGKKLPEVGELRDKLSKMAGSLSDSLPVVEAVEALEEIFQAGPGSIDATLKSFELDCLGLPRDQSGKLMPFSNSESSAAKGPPACELRPEPYHKDDDKLLKRLAKRTIKARTSPLAHPLDAFSADIRSFMRELLQGIDWGKMADSLVLFSRQERLLLGAGEQREHYIHTLKVFLLGRRLLKGLKCYDGFTRPRWILASLLHDVCYPIQQTRDWLGRYVRELAPGVANGKVTTDDFLGNWDDRKYEACWVDALLRLVDRRLQDWLDPRSAPAHRLQASVLYSLLRKQNHAVLGAIGLLMRAQELYKNKKENKDLKGRCVSISDLMARSTNRRREKDTTEWKLEQGISELFDAATAILLHDPKVWRSLVGATGETVSCPQAKLENGGGNRSKNETCAARVTWALAVADAIQEWGRDLDLGARGTDESDSAYWRKPEKITVSRHDPDNPDITIEITYPQAFEEGVVDTVNGAIGDVEKAFGGLKLKTGSLHSSDTATADIAECLSQAAHLWDLVGGEVAPLSRSWLAAALSFLDISELKTYAEGETKELPVDIKKQLEDLAKALSAIPKGKEKDGERAGAGDNDTRQERERKRKERWRDIRRLCGLWTIPSEALRFWRVPGDLKVRVVRTAAGSRIDALATTKNRRSRMRKIRRSRGSAR